MQIRNVNHHTCMVCARTLPPDAKTFQMAENYRDRRRKPPYHSLEFKLCGADCIEDMARIALWVDSGVIDDTPLHAWSVSPSEKIGVGVADLVNPATV